MNWYLNPWRLFTLACGAALLHYGVYYMPAPDWDVTVSYLMAFSTYLMMPLFDKYRRERSTWIVAFLIANFCGDTTYGLYWDYMENHLVSQVINYPASMSLFLACWVIWCLIPETLHHTLKPVNHLIHRSGGSSLD